MSSRKENSVNLNLDDDKNGEFLDSEFSRGDEVIFLFFFAKI